MGRIFYYLYLTIVDSKVVVMAVVLHFFVTWASASNDVAFHDFREILIDGTRKSLSFIWYTSNCNRLIQFFFKLSIQVMSYNSLVAAHQNVPITSLLSNLTLGS